MAVGLKTFNPGDLTVGAAGSTSILYPGQTGTYDANGLAYAVFPDAQTGSAALADYVTRHTAGGSTTLQDLTYHYLGTSTDNAANPHVQNYLSTVSQVSGISPNTVLTPAQAGAVAAGISKGEGTSSIFNLGSGSSALSSASSTLSNVASSLLGSAGKVGTDLATGNVVGAAVDGVGALFGATGIGDWIKGVEDWIMKNLIQPIRDFFSLSKGPWIRIALVVIGGVLLILAILAFLANNPTVQNVATKAAMVAA